MDLETIYKSFLKSKGVTIDSRDVKPDYIFFALKGDQFNGNEYAQQAIEKGCRFAVVDEKKYVKDERYILVNDVLETLQALANYHRNQLNTKVIAITGSNGKTTTKELTQKVLDKKFNILSNIKNYNNHIGVPLTLLNLKQYHDYAIVEMGANHQGEIAKLCDIAEPQYGIITNIGKAHLEGFGSFEGVKKAKGELYDFLDKNNGTIFYNADNPVLVEMAQKHKCLKLTYGEENKENVNYNIQLIRTEPYLKIKTKDGEISSQLIGKYNFENLMTAISLGYFFEVPFPEIKQAIEEYTPTNNRSQLLNSKFNTIILDAYNANPSSMQAAIANFAKYRKKPRVLILGDMFELGKYSMDEHNQLVEFVSQHEFDKVFLIGENFCSLQQNKFPAFETTEEFISFLKNNPLKHYSILIKGSRGMTLEKIAEYL
ncbi:MAG: UDP-N-acetylmuramoyl-tripeptide--D-alanyl-D-alanine ligase [Bacteroidales bacterium]